MAEFALVYLASIFFLYGLFYAIASGLKEWGRRR